MREIIAIILFNLFASIISGCSGFGMSTITTPVLVHFFPVTEVFLFTGLTHVIGSFWILIFMRHAINWKLLFYFGLPSIIGSILGAQLALDLDRQLLMKGMGIFLIFYVIIVRWYANYRFPAYRSWAAIGGLLSGFFAGIFGFSGAIRALFLSSFGMSPGEYIFMSHFFELIIDATRAGNYLHHGIELGPTLYYALLLAPATLILGAYVVRILIARTSFAFIDKWITGALLIEGIRLIVVG